MKSLPEKKTEEKDPWLELKKFTAARIAIGSTGNSIPLKENLEFKLAHAHARDAVYSELEIEILKENLIALQLEIIEVHSEAKDRQEFLKRPDLGRILNSESRAILSKVTNTTDICFILADGLSATAINEHATKILLKITPELEKNNFSIAPIILVNQGRVAIGDEIAKLCKSTLSVVLIGERPGLSSPDSLGAYITFLPTPGTTDEKRNCVSNIRPEGLNIELAAEKLVYLIKESLRLKISGIDLKDDQSKLLNQS